jgi:hypothetical protein
LSEDEEGDLYQTYFNLIWEYVSEKMGTPFWVMNSKDVFDRYITVVELKGDHIYLKGKELKKCL